VEWRVKGKTELLCGNSVLMPPLRQQIPRWPHWDWIRVFTVRNPRLTAACWTPSTFASRSASLLKCYINSLFLFMVFVNLNSCLLYPYFPLRTYTFIYVYEGKYIAVTKWRSIAFKLMKIFRKSLVGKQTRRFIKTSGKNLHVPSLYTVIFLAGCFKTTAGSWRRHRSGADSSCNWHSVRISSSRSDFWHGHHSS